MNVLLGLLVVVEMMVASAPGNVLGPGFDSVLANWFECTVENETCDN
jgi:hypothetical protein